MKKKEPNRTPISIEDEFIGTSVGPRKPKEKKNDTTKDLNILIKQPMSIELIKEIFLRIEGRWIYDKSGESTIRIYAISNHEFIIKINKIKFFEYRYILDSGGVYSIRSLFKNNKEIDTSDLKKLIRFEIYNWLCENLDKVTIIK